MLRAFGLTGNGNAGRKMRDTHGAFRFVDVLSAGARRTIDIDTNVFVRNVDLDGLVDDWIDRDAGKTRVPARIGIER